MRPRPLFLVAGLGLALGIGGAFYFAHKRSPPPPAYNPASNPYASGIYANGIVESDQGSAANLNLFPEVGGTVAKVLVTEGERVSAGTALVALDPAVQAASASALQSQVAAASAVLDELKHQPRPETLEVVRAQWEAAQAVLKQARDTLEKQRRSFALDSRSVSRDVLDTAENAARVAAANAEVARRQYELTRAGAWQYDVRNQQRLRDSLQRQYEAADALLGKYTLRAPVDGVVLAINTTAGNYVSPQGAYDAYTQGNEPVVVMSTPQDTLAVRVYVDEILVHRLPSKALRAQMQLRGVERRIPLTFVRIQPYVTPKIELSSQRQERVDLRVLPVLFRFRRPADLPLYPGQLVDVYIDAGAR